MVGCYRWCRYVLGDIWTLNSKRQSDRTSLHGDAASSRFGGGCRQTGTSRSVCFLTSSNKKRSIRNNSLSSSSPRAPPPHPRSHLVLLIMSVAGSFNETRKRYCLCDFCRRLLSLSVWGVPIVIAFSPNLTFDPESKHSS